jgi:hypothetical protein
MFDSNIYKSYCAGTQLDSSVEPYIADPEDPVYNFLKGIIDEEKVLDDWAHCRSIVHTSMTHHMSERKVNNIRSRLRLKYDRIQPYTDLPKRNTRP